MPPVTLALLAANIAAFVLQNMLRGQAVLWFALWPPSVPGAPAFEPWQLITYGFLHGGMGHLFFNMFALYMFGPELERLFGARFFLNYYLVSVITAALTHLVVTGWMGAPPAPMVGASGAMFGLLLAYGWVFPQRKLLLIFLPVPHNLESDHAARIRAGIRRRKRALKMNDNPVYYHTQKCLDLQATREKIHLEWITAWPSYCHHCHATGEISTPGSSVPYGSINVNLPDDVDHARNAPRKVNAPVAEK